MPAVLKIPADIAGMRIAGRLAAEVLDFISPQVKIGVTTDERSPVREFLAGLPARLA